VGWTVEEDPSGRTSDDHRRPARAEGEVSMTPDQFLLEYWKEYRAYMGNKEHLIEIATTLYLAFVSALLLRDDSFWLDRNPRIFALTLWAFTTLIVLRFIVWQFGYWSDAARICNASQTVLTRWMAKTPEDAELAPVTGEGFRDVDVVVPKALVDEMQRRRERWNKLSLCRRWCDAPFETVVYGLGIVWAVALLIRVWAATC
jgi:hypothetical protein